MILCVNLARLWDASNYSTLFLGLSECFWERLAFDLVGTTPSVKGRPEGMTRWGRKHLPLSASPAERWGPPAVSGQFYI